MKKGTTKNTRRKYDADFKEQILTIHANGRSIRSLSRANASKNKTLDLWEK